MSLNIWLFIKISVFFFGVSFAAAYLIHRLIFIFHKRSLIRIFPEAFDICFSLVNEFFEILKGATHENIDRFLVQVVARKKIDLPGTFRDLPEKVVRGAYHELVKFRKRQEEDPGKILDQIRTTIYQQYFQSYKRIILYESLNWLLVIIPLAILTGLIIPLVFFFHMPYVVLNWPDLLTVTGIVLTVGTVVVTVRDYFLRG
ncbi:hypothetical protein JXA40_01010 [bacterium]|nr:hypothetical protein [candidate division CSSED10-310 bacterium]